MDSEESALISITTALLSGPFAAQFIERRMVGSVERMIVMIDERKLVGAAVRILGEIRRTASKKRHESKHEPDF